MSKSLSEGDPCPGRILADAGGGFAVGAVGGSVFRFIKGLRDSPNGARITGGMRAARMNAPRVGGSFAVWGGLFSTFNCTAVYVRQKEDPWNPVFAGAATSGLLSVRQGLRAAGRSTVIGGVLLAFVEGMSIFANRLQAAQAQQNLPPVHDPNLAATGFNRLHAAQQSIPHVDDLNLTAAVANCVHLPQVDDPNLAADVANSIHAAQQNLPPVDDPAIAAGGGGFQGSGEFQRLPQPTVSSAPTEVAGSSGDGPFGKQVEETKKPNEAMTTVARFEFDTTRSSPQIQLSVYN